MTRVRDTYTTGGPVAERWLGPWCPTPKALGTDGDGTQGAAGVAAALATALWVPVVLGPRLGAPWMALGGTRLWAGLVGTPLVDAAVLALVTPPGIRCRPKMGGGGEV